MSGEPPTTQRGPTPFVLVAGLVVLASLAFVGFWLLRRNAPVAPATPTSKDLTDPRRTYTGPYRNIDPDVRYVGDAQCAGCHDGIIKSYSQHPMGRSMAATADFVDQQHYGSETNNPFTALGRQFEVVRQGKRVWHRQTVLDDAGKPVVELDQEVSWVIGSGSKGLSYLTERDGYLLQTPISWFRQKQGWDLSPGFEAPLLTGRVVTGACLFCHANRVQPHPEHTDRYSPPVFEGHAIGCERCHGPGELHVKGNQDHTIVNPGRLSPPLRDAVCEQCHLEGEARMLRSGRELFDYRPGLPMSDFWAVLVPLNQTGEDAKVVNHVEQMVHSRCFQRPVGELKMGCITCHNPHVHIGPQERDMHYRAMCLKCHDVAKGQQDCSLPLAQRRQTSPIDSCIACHMKRYPNSDIPHAASTDHRILRRPLDRASRPVDLNHAQFGNFYQDRFPQGDPQAERTFGRGLVQMMTAGMLPPERYGQRALLALESALGQFPLDPAVRESKAKALGLLGRHAEVLEEYRLALDIRPGDWRMWAQGGGAAQAAGHEDVAIDYYRRAVNINPFVVYHQVRLVNLLIRAGQLEEARSRCAKLLELDPFNVYGRQAWVSFLLREGKKTEAHREFETIRRLRPPDLAKREEWFQQQLR